VGEEKLGGDWPGEVGEVARQVDEKIVDADHSDDRPPCTTARRRTALRRRRPNAS
jgi:hypothetical protein